MTLEGSTGTLAGGRRREPGGVDDGSDGVSQLRVRVGERELTADGSKPIVIGRDGTADIVSTCDQVSRHHAVVWLDPAQGWVLQDTDSRNGTYREGERVGRVLLDAPVVVWLGHPVTGEAIELEPLVERARPGGPLADQAVLGVPMSVGQPASVYRAEGILRIGRGQDNDLVLDDILVSRHHAELRPDGSGFSIVDLGSHNGTYVDGARVKEAHLTRGSLVSIGRHLLRLVDGALEEYVDTGQIDFAAYGLRVEIKGGRRLLNDVSFSLGPSNLLAILGPTGVGKSTLLKALTGFVPADHGTVLYNGRDLYAAYDELRHRIGYVPQDDILHPDLTVRRALEFAARLRLPRDLSEAERTQRVCEVIAELGLTERADLAIHRLSGGQRKRTSVALELLAQPSLLFLDEPTSGLDPGYEKAVMELLREVADTGRTVIVITHSVQSLDLCDRVLFLAPGGNLAYFGNPAAVTERFGVREYADVFTRIDRSDPAEWTAGTGPPTVPLPAAPPPPGPRPTGRVRSQSGWGRQVATLARRYLAIIAADRRTLALLLLQGPLVGLILLGTTKEGGLAQSGVVNSRAALVLVNLVLAVTFIGLTNAVREIVKELPIYRRERAVGLSLSAYLTSKALVLGAFTVLQAVVLTLIATARQGGLNDPVSALGSARAELVISMVLTALAAMATGLLISSVVSSADKATLMLPLVLLLSVLLASPNLEVATKPVAKQLAQLTTAKWGFAASGSVVGFYTLIARPDCEVGPTGETAESSALKEVQRQMNLTIPRCDSAVRHRAATWYLDLGALGALTVGQIVIAGLLLRRQDPTRRRPRR
jgi:ABC transport system ATP-binding/permease protein